MFTSTYATTPLWSVSISTPSASIVSGQFPMKTLPLLPAAATSMLSQVEQNRVIPCTCCCRRTGSQVADGTPSTADSPYPESIRTISETPGLIVEFLGCLTSPMLED